MNSLFNLSPCPICRTNESINLVRKNIDAERYTEKFRCRRCGFSAMALLCDNSASHSDVVKKCHELWKEAVEHAKIQPTEFLQGFYI